ncbi:zinc-binding alcohol dehydrogenase [Verrucomicrobiota bacterium]
MSDGGVENRVFYFTEPGRMEVGTEECPLPGPGEIRCRTICSLVSIGTEMICFARKVEKGSSWDEWIQYPFEPGYLSVGEVTDLGEGVEGIQAGDRVCSNAPHRAWFIDRPEKILTVPEGIAPEQAAWFHLNIIVQNGIREVGPALGETSVVIGLGPLGQLAVRLLGLAGQRHLIAIDPIGARCELAQGHGPTEVWNTGAEEAVERVISRTDGEGADTVFDITGNARVFHAAHRMLRKRGRLGLIGDVPFPSQQTMTHDVLCKGVAIIAAHGAMPPFEGTVYHRWGRREMSAFFFDMVLSGRIDISNLITHRIRPEDAPAFYGHLLNHRDDCLGVVVDWSE